MQQLEQQRELLQEYFGALKSTESKTANVRKQALSTLVDLLKYNFKQFQDIEATGMFHAELHKGFWDNTFDIFVKCFKTELYKAKPTKGPLEESARCLSKLVLDMFDESEPYFFLRYGDVLLELCKLVFSEDEDSGVYEACARSFADVLRRALRVESAVEFKLTRWFFMLSIDRMLNDELMDNPDALAEFANNAQQQRVNFGEVCRLCMQSWGFQLANEHATAFLRVCAEYCQTLAKSRRRNTTPVHIDLITALQQYVEVNGMNCIALLRIQGKRIVDNLIEADRSVVRSPIVLGVFRAMGRACCEFSVHHGADLFLHEDLAWLNVERIQVNLMSFLGVVDVRSTYDDMLRRRLSELPAADMFASCLADYLYYVDYALKRKNISCEIDSFTAKCCLGLDLDAATIVLRCQHLIVLHSLVERWGITTKPKPATLLARLEHLLRLASDKTTVEVFWLVRTLGALCNAEKHDNMATNEIWSQAYSCLIGRMLIKPSTPVPLAVCAAFAAAKMARSVNRPALAQSLEAMWKVGVFNIAKSKQSPLHLAKLVIALPLHEMLIEFPVDRFERGGGGQPNQQMEEEESVPSSCPSLRCELVSWAFRWAMSCCGGDEDGGTNESLVFANAMQTLLVETMAPLAAASKSTDLNIGDCLTNMSRLRISSDLTTPVVPLTWRKSVIKWTCDHLFVRANNAAPKLLLVFTKMPKVMFNNNTALNLCFQQIATLAQTDLSLLPVLQLALESTVEIDSANKHLVFTLARTQLDKLFTVTPPPQLEARNKRLKLVKQQRKEEEDKEEEAMFGSSEPRAGQSLSASERSNTLDSTTLPVSSSLQPMNLLVSRHARALAQLLVMTCEDNNEAFQLVETYLIHCSNSRENDTNVQLSFARAMVYLACNRDTATFTDLVLDVVIGLAKRKRDSAEVISFCASSLLRLAQCYTTSKTQKFPFTGKQCEEWFVGSKLFLNADTFSLRFRADRGAVLSPQTCLDFCEALFQFANMPGSPEKLFNLAIHVLTENLNHVSSEVRNLCSRRLVHLLHAVEGHDKVLKGVLESGWGDYNRTRTNLVFASELAVQSQENLLPQVLVQFTLCLDHSKRGKRKVLVMRLLLCLLKALKYESAKQVLLYHAEFLYTAFFSKPDSQLDHFPFDLFGLASTEELCLVTTHVLVPVLFLLQRRDVLLDKFQVNDLREQRANVYGLVHTRRDSALIRKALRLYHELVNDDAASSLSSSELVRAVNQAMSCYCFQAINEVSLQSISLDALFTNETKFSHFHLVEILLHLKYLLTFPSKIWPRVLDCMRVTWQEWIDGQQNNVTLNEYWMYSVLFVFAKSSSSKQLQDQAFSLLKQAEPLFTPMQFETSQTVVLDQQSSLQSSSRQYAVNYAGKLVDMFPKSRCGSPGSTQLTTSFLLSTSPAISEPRCRSLLLGLLQVLPTRVHSTATVTNEDPPMEIARSLRPFVGNTPPQTTAHSPSTVDDDDDMLVDCLLSLCAMDISPQVRNLAAQCLARFGQISPQCNTTLSVQPSSSDSSSLDSDVLAFKTQALDWLVEMLSSENAMLAMCACQTIKALLGTESGKLCSAKTKQHVLLSTTIHMQESTSEPKPGTELYDMLSDKRSLALNFDSLSKDLWDTASINAMFTNAEDWICTVTDLLCRDSTITGDEFIGLLGPVALLEPRFAKMIFPWIVFNCVRMDNAVATAELSLCFKQMLRTYESQCRPVHRLLVDTVSFLRGKRIADNLSCTAPPTAALLRSPIVDRLKSSGRSSRSGGVNNAALQQQHGNVDYRSFWLDLDLLQIANIALQCDMPSMVILCVEIWQELCLPRHQGNAVEGTMFMTRPKHDQLLLGAYRLLNDRDAILGVQRTTNLVDTIEDLRFDGDWLGALTGYDAMRLQTWSTPTNVLLAGQAQTLAQLGLTHTMQGVLASTCDDDNNMTEIKLEGMWRAQSVAANNSCDATIAKMTSIHSVLVNAYQALRTRDLNKLQEIKTTGINLLLGDLYETESLETRNVCLSRLNICFDLDQPSSQCLTKEHFAAREGMLRSVQNSAALKTHLVEFADFLRLQHECMPAALVLDRLRRECSSDGSNTLALDAVKLHLQDAMVCWLRGDEETALRVAKYVHNHVVPQTGDDYAAAQFSPALKCLVGFWLTKSSATSSEVVLHDWFNKAVLECELVCKQFPLQECNAMLSSIHHLMATYVDRQFRALDSRLKSPEYISSQTLQRQREADLEMLRQEYSMEKSNKAARGELRTAILRLEKECFMDSAEEARVHASRSNLLVLTVDHLFASLQTSTASNHDTTTSIIFRIIHLWFHNRVEVNDLVKQWLLVGPRRVPSRHLIPLVYQIVSRVDMAATSDDAFQAIVNQLVKDLAIDHPFDTLPHLFALSNSNRLAETPTRAPPPATTGGEEGTSSKRKAAVELLHQIKSHSPQIREICLALESTYDAFIALAYHTTAKDKKEFNAKECREFALAKQRITWDVIPLPCNSSNNKAQVKLHQIEDTYRVTDQGISVPKILTLVGSDGKRTKLLVKGKDDLRQDFVMELILGFVSGLLQSKSPMRLRTYQVLPLTPAAGLIEWVEHTTSLGTYLYGGHTHEERAQSAHARHCPNDLSFNECLHMLKDAAEARVNRLEVYRKVRSEFHPVFRHFFFERYGHDAKEWHKRRDAYTRSTAANSMVGMILGIGDRHAQNILIDERTAEVIHIDFGVTFEQGKALRTPETVPCRLTPDVVDGFGTAGVHGVFTRACIESLSVLRDNADSILTICEVFVHDPLHKWDVSSLKQRRIEARTEGEEADLTRVIPAIKTQNVEAGRVLHRLRKRLEGHVDDGEPLQVTAQVKRVIQEATDEANLCLLYCGWAPFL